MASTELVIAFGARLDGFEGSLKRVNTALENLRTQVQTQAQAITQTAEQSSSSWDALAAGVTRAGMAYAAFRTAVAAGSGMAALISQSSDLTGTFNRMVIQLNGLSGIAQNVFGNLLAVANRSGVAFNDVAESFTRFSVAMSSSSLPTTSQEIARVVEMLTRMTQLAGSSQGATAAIYQLSQGLASGRLQGEELKSIMENLPPLAQGLARELGVTVGRLREMGSEGRNTAEVVFPALLRMADTMEQRMGNLPLTVSQAWTATRNSFIAAVNAIDQAIGASSNIVAFLGGLNRISDFVRRGAGGSTPTESRTAAGNAEVRTQSLIIAGLAEQSRLQQEIETARARGLDTSRLWAALEITNQSLVALGFRAEEQGYSRITDASREAMEAEIERFNSRQSAGQNARQNFANEARELRRAHDDRFRIEDDARQARERLNQRWDAVSAENRTNASRLEYNRALAAINREEREQIRALERRQSAEDRAGARRAERADSQAAREAEANRKRLMNNTYPEIEFTEMIRANTTAVVEAFRQAQGMADVTRIAFGLVDEAASRMFRRMIDAGQNPREAFARIQEDLVNLEAAIRRNGVNPGENFVSRGLEAAERTLDRFRIKFQTWSDMAREAVQQFSRAAADAIVDFATGSSKNFSKMAEDFAKSIAKMILNAMIFRAVMLGLRAVGVDLTLVLPGRMAGGPVQAGSPYIVGEKRPELFVPGSSGYIFPTVPNGGGGEVTVNVYNSTSANTRVQERQNAMGGKTIDIFVEDIVNRGLATGRFDSAMRASFGASRLGRV